MLMPSDASSALRSLSALMPSAGESNNLGSRSFSLASFWGGRRAHKGPNDSGSAPKSKASCNSSEAPGGASAATEARAKGISARGASAGLLTQICSEHLQRRNRISVGRRSCTKLKSSGHEKFLSHRVWPSSLCGSRTPRRHRPLSATDSRARDSMGAPCFPGCFGSRAKNCVSLEAMAIASASSCPRGLGLASTTGFCLPGLVTQERPRFLGGSSFTGLSMGSGSCLCLKASTSIQPNAHWTSSTGSLRCSSKKMWPRLSSHPQSGSMTTWREEKGAAASAEAAESTSSRSSSPPWTRAQSANARAATAARARSHCRLAKAGVPGAADASAPSTS
mmetsp:Transcript_115509/g.274540  ORF Transcript_115509/g.274540 Transcript_115509/m.274540 type:complete len:336 (+) Transcript_115509:286-1293(+)